MNYYYRKGNSFCIYHHKLEPLKNGFVELTEEEYFAQKQERDIAIRPSNGQFSFYHRIIELKQLLQQTDYQAIKYAEGYFTEEEYAPIKEQRQAWRNEINQLESELEQENE